MGDSAALLPSARVLLKRREAAEVERGLQRQREVRAAPVCVPRVCPTCVPSLRLQPWLPWETYPAVHGLSPVSPPGVG